MTGPAMNQIAMSVTDLPRTHAWYTGAFGFVPASGTNAFKGYIAEKVQGVPGARSSCWWLGDQQEFFQIELFQFERPERISLSTLKLKVPTDLKALRERATHRRRIIQRERYRQAIKTRIRIHKKTETIGMFEMDIL